jgi:HK97 family phage portal protein
MGLFDFFKRSQERKESTAFTVHYQHSGADARWMPRDYSSFAREAYTLNVIAYSAINRIADAVAGMDWIAWRGENELSESPYLDLVRRPNPRQSGQEFWRAKTSFLLIAGNGYDERVIIGGAPREVWTLRPDRMTISQAPNGMPNGYVYAAGGKKVRFEADEITGESDIRHTLLFNPLDDLYGMSPVEAAAYSIDSHNEASAWLKSLLQNSATPSGAMIVKDDAMLTDDQFNRLKHQIEEQYTGARNAGRPMLLEGGMDWKALGLSPTDMNIIEAKFASAREICLAFGVPPMLLGIPGDNTYSNYQEARMAFYEDTVIPLVQYMIGEWNAWLGPAFGGVELRPDLDQIPAIAEKRRELWSTADAAIDITLNESRAMKGYPPIPGPRGNVLMADIRNPPQSENAVLAKMAYGY